MFLHHLVVVSHIKQIFIMMDAVCFGVYLQKLKTAHTAPPPKWLKHSPKYHTIAKIIKTPKVTNRLCLDVTPVWAYMLVRLLIGPEIF